MTTTDSRHDSTVDARPYSHERDATLDATFDALAARPCRLVLRSLAEGDDDAVNVRSLADRLVEDGAAASESDSGAADDAGAARLRARLHHGVLPKLADVGLVDYDPDRGVVEHRPDSGFAAMASALAAYESDETPVALDALLELLADFRRRQALLTLFAHEDISLPDLADEVAVAEFDEHLPRIDAEDVLRVYLSLYHTHVPKLRAAGLVTYDQDDDYVVLTDAGRALDSPVRSLCDPADG